MGYQLSAFSEGEACLALQFILFSTRRFFREANPVFQAWTKKGKAKKLALVAYMRTNASIQSGILTYTFAYKTM
jgi:hypothetical protein